MTALSALLLGEQVGWRRWTAVDGRLRRRADHAQSVDRSLTWPALIALAGSICFALLMIMTRYLRGTPDIVMATGQIGTTLMLAARHGAVRLGGAALVDVC